MFYAFPTTDKVETPAVDVTHDIIAFVKTAVLESVLAVHWKCTVDVSKHFQYDKIYSFVLFVLFISLRFEPYVMLRYTQGLIFQCKP